MKAFFAALVSVLAISASAMACSEGSVVYHNEDITPGANHETIRPVKYVCVGGQYAKNGIVAAQPQLADGTVFYVNEDVTPGSNTATIRPVKYVVINGQAWKNGIVLDQSGKCTEGTVGTDYETVGNGMYEQQIFQKCVGAKWVTVARGTIRKK